MLKIQDLVLYRIMGWARDTTFRDLKPAVGWLVTGWCLGALKSGNPIL